MLSSWNVAKSIHNSISSDEVGIGHCPSTLSLSLSIQSYPPLHNINIVVLDSDSLSINPQSTLESLCQDLHIPYTESMLTWSSGKHHCDGPWADWWYADVHKSTGWIRNHDANSHLTNRKYRTLHPSLLGVLRSSMPAYEVLKSLSKRYQMRGPKAEDIYEDPRNEHVSIRFFSSNFAASSITSSSPHTFLLLILSRSSSFSSIFLLFAVVNFHPIIRLCTLYSCSPFNRY